MINKGAYLNIVKKAKFLLICSMIIGGILFLFYKSIFLSIACCPISLKFLKEYEEYFLKNKRKVLRDQFKDALYFISSSIQSGHSMKDAISETLESLNAIYGETSVIVDEFNQMIVDMDTKNMSEEDALKEFAARSRQEEISDFVDVYCICKKTGGDMSSIITKSTAIITDKMNVRKEIDVITAQKKIEALILTVMPIIVVFFLQVFSGEYFKVMYETFEGRIIMTIALLGIVYANHISNKIINIEI